MGESYSEYGFKRAGVCGNVGKILPVIEALAGEVTPGMRVLDVGCGNGSICARFAERGCTAVGIDPSDSGIELAREHYPQCRFEQITASADLLDRLGEDPFDLVVSTEVIEHVYAPREWAQGIYACLRPGGHMVCTTPYHGYLKNLLIALTNKWDAHVNPLWDGGHIKFWSPATLSGLLEETGFRDIRWRGAGRAPMLWMSFVMRGTRPES